MTCFYVDASALVKRYVNERHTEETVAAIAAAEAVGTGVVSRAEVSAALAKAVRVGIMPEEDALAALQAFRQDWPDLVRVQLNEGIVERADRLAWQANLRGHDAIHLASALSWQELLGDRITLATFDLALWQAGKEEGLSVFPATWPGPPPVARKRTRRTRNPR